MTSSTSAELIGCSSVLTYDIYRTYINPKASGKRLVHISHICVLGFGLAMGALSTMFNYIGVTITFMITFVGILLCPSVPALVGCIFFSRMNKISMILAPILGLFTGLASWLGAAYHFGGGILNVTTLGGTYATLIGNGLSLFSPVLYIVILSAIWPAKFDFSHFANDISLADDSTALQANIANDVLLQEEQRRLRSSLKYGYIMGFGLVLLFMILIPITLYATGYIFSLNFFTGYVVIVFLWAWLAALFITLAPIWESRHSFLILYQKLRGTYRPKPLPTEGRMLNNDLTEQIPESKLTRVSVEHKYGQVV